MLYKLSTAYYYYYIYFQFLKREELKKLYNIYKGIYVKFYLMITYEGMLMV